MLLLNIEISSLPTIREGLEFSFHRVAFRTCTHIFSGQQLACPQRVTAINSPFARFASVCQLAALDARAIRSTALTANFRSKLLHIETPAQSGDTVSDCVGLIHTRRKSGVVLMGIVWHWETIDPNRLNASGNLAKTFKNEAPEARGVLAQGPPSDEATLLVREAIQNSWDSALEMRDRLQATGTEVHPFEVRFKFRSVSGRARENLILALGLRELAERSAEVGDKSKLGLSPSDCLDGLDRPGDLHLLEVVEQAAGGMYGPWIGNQSKMALALSSTGVTSDVPGRGGSYGYGKAGLIRGSATRTVLAYTCFAERSDDPGITRRLLGMTYWDTHTVGRDSFVGSARLGRTHEETTAVPLENEDADQLARLLRFEIRNPRLPADHGTSFLLVDPTVEPEDLANAVERNWWPALMEPSLHFNVVIEDIEGALYHPRPRSNATLRPFIDAYEAATVPQDNKREHIRTRVLQKIGQFEKPGTLGLVADLDDWSNPDDRAGEPADSHCSLVALVRTPRMVVEYLDAGRSVPYVRGCFVADESVNEALRQTEPKGHDSWQTRVASGDFDPKFAELAKEIIFKIKNNLNSFRAELKPPPKPSEAVRLPEFDRLMKALLSGGGGGERPPVSEERPFSIQPGGLLEEAEEGQVRLRGKARIGFSSHYLESGGERREVEVKIRYRFREGDRIGRDTAVLLVEEPQGWRLLSGRDDTYRGYMESDEAVEFIYESDEYDPEWTGHLSVTADFVTSQDASLPSDGSP